MDNNKCCNCSNNGTNCGIHDSFSIQTANQNNSGITTSTGDSRAIRIGNDIKLDVTIQELNGMDIINIKAIKCFIINTTPMMQDHCGNAYEIHRCGLPIYHIHPFLSPYPFDRGPFLAPCEYHGCGIYPMHCKNWHHNLFPHHDYFCRNPYGHHYLHCINPDKKPFEFIAPVKALPDRNKVRVFFPASAQLLCGMYSLTFVIDLYEPGYHCNNLRTITVDYNNVFELVPNMEGAAGDITIDIDKQIGLNTLDSFMFGNTTSNTISNVPLIQSISIGPDEDIRVGQVVEYTATTSPYPSANISWSLSDTGHAMLGSTMLNIAQVYGKSISNVVEGYDQVILNAHATDGSNVTGSKVIKIHNYATDINFGAYEDLIILPYQGSKTASIYVTQEDGTKVAMCEMGCNCQAIETGSAYVTEKGAVCVDITKVQKEQTQKDSDWEYVDDDTESCPTKCCCEDTEFTITNLNNQDETKIAYVMLKSRLKNKDGEYVTKEIKVICIGKKGLLPGDTTPSDEGDENPNDKYITGMLFDPDTNNLTATVNLYESEDLTADLSDWKKVSPNYWYSEQ